MNEQKRVLIIGLDGFCWGLGEKFLKENWMPALGSFTTGGSFGTLQSVLPYETSPAWVSFQTGCFPPKTGIFSFHTFDSQTSRIRLNSSGDIRVPTLWELLSSQGKKTICVNMPLTSPPPAIDGIIIPGLLCPQLNSQTVHPSAIYGRFIKPRKDYQIVDNTYRNTVSAFAEQSIRTEQVRCEVALELMDGYDWDVFCLQIQSTDLFQHRFWWALDSGANGYNQEDYRQAAAFYKCCDDIISRLIDKAGSNVRVILVSDHGFTAQRWTLAVNRWLLEKGYLLLLEKEKSGWQRAKEKSVFLKYFAQQAGRTKGFFVKAAERFFPPKTPPFSEIELLHLRQSIDFMRSKAFYLGSVGGVIYIHPSVPHRDDFRNRLIEELLTDFGPAAQPALVKAVKTCAEEYGDLEGAALLPDLLLEYEPGVSAVINPLAPQLVQSYQNTERQPGTHDRNGLFAAQGENIKKNFRCDCQIVDIVPTVLAMLDIPIPAHIDGRILSEIFEKEPRTAYSGGISKDSQPTYYSDREQSEVEKRLADLGYL